LQGSLPTTTGRVEVINAKLSAQLYSHQRKHHN